MIKYYKNIVNDRNFICESCRTWKVEKNIYTLYKEQNTNEGNTALTNEEEIK